MFAYTVEKIAPERIFNIHVSKLSRMVTKAHLAYNVNRHTVPGIKKEFINRRLLNIRAKVPNEFYHLNNGIFSSHLVEKFIIHNFTII